MFIKKSTKAASIIGYGMIVGLISVVTIAALENTGKNTDNLFSATSDKLSIAANTGAGGNQNDETPDPSNLILVTSDLSAIEGTNGDDIFIILGENSGVDGPQTTYTSGDLSSTTGGFDISSLVNVGDVNNRIESSLGSGATINGNGGNDSILVFGNANLANIDPNLFSNIFLNSGIKLDAGNGLNTVRIEGNGVDSYIEFTGAGQLVIGQDVNMENIPAMIVNSGIEIEIQEQLLSGFSTLSGAGTLVMPVITTPGILDNLTIDPALTVYVEPEGTDPHFANVNHLISINKNGGIFNVKSGINHGSSGVSLIEDTPWGYNKAIAFSNGGYVRTQKKNAVLGTNQDFTIDLWLRNRDGDTGYIVSKQYFNKGRDWGFYVSGGGSNIGFNVSNTFSVNWPVNIGTSGTEWHHIAVVRNSNTMSLFVDGVQQGAPKPFTANLPNRTDMEIFWGRAGGPVTNNSYRFIGDMADMRMTPGVVRYTENFAPPGAPVPHQ